MLTQNGYAKATNLNQTYAKASPLVLNQDTCSAFILTAGGKKTNRQWGWSRFGKSGYGLEQPLNKRSAAAMILIALDLRANVVSRLRVLFHDGFCR